MAASLKAENAPSYFQHMHMPHQNLYSCLPKIMNNYFYNSISQTLETTQLCINKRMDILQYIHTIQRKIENKTSYHLTHDRIHLAEMILREKKPAKTKKPKTKPQKGEQPQNVHSV